MEKYFSIRRSNNAPLTFLYFVSCTEPAGPVDPKHGANIHYSYIFTKFRRRKKGLLNLLLYLFSQFQ